MVMDNLFVLNGLILYKLKIYHFIEIDFSILSNNSLKSMGRFKIQLLLADNTWITRYNIPKSDRYSNSSTQWALGSVTFTVENYGINLLSNRFTTC